MCCHRDIRIFNTSWSARPIPCGTNGLLINRLWRVTLFVFTASTAKESSNTPLREVTLKQCQVNLSRHSSAVIVESSTTGNDHEWSKLSTVTSPKRKKPSTSMSMGIEHNIPHKLVFMLSTYSRMLSSRGGGQNKLCWKGLGACYSRCKYQVKFYSEYRLFDFATFNLFIRFAL